MQIDRSIIAGGILIACLIGYLAFFGNNESQLPEGIIKGNGRIEAVQIDISTKIAGRIKQIMAREGDLVGEGQQLALIDAAQLQAQLYRAKADIARAQSLVAQAKASIAQAKAQLNLAKKELDRASALVKRGHTSEQTYDIRVNQHEVAKANLGAAEAMLVSRERGVDAARAGAQEIETQIKDCVLISPTIGRVLYRLAEPGEVLGPGGKVLTLVNLADVYMEIFLLAKAAHRLSIGSEARIVIDGTDFAIPATVSFVSPRAQFTPKQVETFVEREKLMFRVKVRVPRELVKKHIDLVKTGIRGIAYVRRGIKPPDWPEHLEKRFEGVPEKQSGS